MKAIIFNNKYIKCFTLLIVFICLSYNSSLLASSVSVKDNQTFDVIVVGSDPEGIAAALSASRNGLNTLLVDSRKQVGGLYTQGWLNTLDLNVDKSGSKSILNKGIFNEFYVAMGQRGSFDISKAQQFFDESLRKSNVTLLLGTDENIDPILKGNNVNGVTVKKDNNVLNLFSKTLIYATQDADIAAKAGVPYKFGREDLGYKGEVDAATLVFAVKNVNWDMVKQDLNSKKTTSSGADNYCAWGYNIMFQCPTKSKDIMIRGLNVGRQQDGTVIINALQIFNLNPLDKNAKKAAYANAVAELPGIMKFIRKNLPGWQKAELLKEAPELYIRESRHIVGVKTLAAEDIYQNKFPQDTIALGSYPIDIQARAKGMEGSALSGTSPYGIHFGVMVPQNVDGLLVTSRCSSFDIVACGSARTVPVGMALGQAAGVAAKVAKDTGLPFRQLALDQTNIKKIRDVLIQEGVVLDPITVINKEKNSWAFPYILYLRDKALLSRGYSNDYLLGKKATVDTIGKMFVLINDNSTLNVPSNIIGFTDSALLTGEVYLKILNHILGMNFNTYNDIYKYGIIDKKTLSHLSYEKAVLKNEQAYALVGGLVKYLIHLRTP